MHAVGCHSIASAEHPVCVMRFSIHHGVTFAARIHLQLQFGANHVAVKKDKTTEVICAVCTMRIVVYRQLILPAASIVFELISNVCNVIVFAFI